MPIYEFTCKRCNNEFEKMVSMSELPEHPTCPECNSNDTIKIISLPNINFEGNGFWVNDYKDKESS